MDQPRILKRFLAYFKEIWFLWGLCLILNIITFFTVWFKIHPTGRPLALHYNVLVGVDWYGSGTNLFLIPVVGFLISLANFSLYFVAKDDKNYLSFLSVFVSLMVQLVLLAAVLFLSGVN